MKITYISHSGFLAETSRCFYLFDYYMGKLPALDASKPILVFSSHAHADHYNSAVFAQLADWNVKDIHAVLSKDIPRKKYPDNIPVTTVTFHQEYALPCETALYTLHSTDKGVAFLVTCPEGILYHAGDLNDWVWRENSEQENRQMTGSYRHEIDLLKDRLQGKTVDAAFLPLDPRQEEAYARGILYFLKKIKTSRVYPMHYWGKAQIIGQFVREYPEYRALIRDTEAAKGEDNT